MSSYYSLLVIVIGILCVATTANGDSIVFNTDSLCYVNNDEINYCNFEDPTIWIGGVVPSSNDSAYISSDYERLPIVVYNSSKLIEVGGLIMDHSVFSILLGVFSVITNVTVKGGGSLGVPEGSSFHIGGSMHLSNKSGLYLEGYTSVQHSVIISDGCILRVPEGGGIVDLATANLHVTGTMIVEVGATLRITGSLTQTGLLQFDRLPNVANLDVDYVVRIRVSGNATVGGYMWWTFTNSILPSTTLLLPVIQVNGSISGSFTGPNTMSFNYGSGYIYLEYTPPTPHKDGYKWYYFVLIGVAAVIVFSVISYLVNKIIKRKGYNKVPVLK